MFSSDMLMDNIWAHLEEAPVEKSQCFHSCSFYSKINSSFIVTYMYWNSFTFQTHLDGFTCATPCVFFLWTFFDVWNFLRSHLGILVITVSRAVWVPIDGIWHYRTIKVKFPGNPIGQDHFLRYPCSFPDRS